MMMTMLIFSNLVRNCWTFILFQPMCSITQVFVNIFDYIKNLSFDFIKFDTAGVTYKDGSVWF